MESFFLKQPKYRNHLGEEEMKQLASIVQFRTAGKNEVLVPCGKPVKEVFYIQKGFVRLMMPDENGKEINTHLAWDGMFITSYYSLINQQVSDESVVTITDCALYHVRYEQMEALYDSFPRLERLGRIIAEEAISCLAERGCMLQSMTAKERYLHQMNTMPPEIFLTIPLQDIASYLGIAPGSLSRIRNEILHIC